jgi:hemolysin activation/secretion protein
VALAAAIALAGWPRSEARAADAEPPTEPSLSGRTADIAAYDVVGASLLSTTEIELALEPFLGPGRPIEDVEKARAAVEKLYQDKGYQAVTVSIPQQTVRNGEVRLRVNEARVGRLRIRGSRWFSLSEIRRQAPSVEEGKVLNFNDLMRDVVALNQLPDRRVAPVLRAGAIPGTVDVDLNVQDNFPLHGSLELNNRYSTGTVHARLAGSLHYDNLWQIGHSLSFSFQVAPKRLDDAKVFSASYLARLPGISWLSLLANGVVQDSDVSTVGGILVSGRGRILGGRAMFTLPGTSRFFQSISTGLDYKRFQEKMTLGDGTISETPITYWPVTVQYAGTVQGESSLTQFGASVIFNLRSLSSDSQQFDDKRVKASGNFGFYRADLSRTEELPLGFQAQAKVQGQYSRDPLLSSEQFTAGGAETVRGYQEGEAVGDYGAAASFEARSPSLAPGGQTVLTDLRLVGFAEGAWLAIHEATVEQKPSFQLASAGGGVRIKLFDSLSGAFDVGVPLRTNGTMTQRLKPRLHFRVWGEF